MASKYFHCANTITVGTDTVTIGFSTAVTASDKDRFCFRLTDSIPSSAATYPVVLTVNGISTVELWNKYGDQVTGADLEKCRTYVGWYGSDTPHVIMTNSPVTCNLSIGNVIG